MINLPAMSKIIQHNTLTMSSVGEIKLSGKCYTTRKNHLKEHESKSQICCSIWLEALSNKEEFCLGR